MSYLCMIVVMGSITTINVSMHIFNSGYPFSNSLVFMHYFRDRPNNEKIIMFMVIFLILIKSIMFSPLQQIPYSCMFSDFDSTTKSIVFMHDCCDGFHHNNQ